VRCAAERELGGMLELRDPRLRKVCGRPSSTSRPLERASESHAQLWFQGTSVLDVLHVVGGAYLKLDAHKRIVRRLAPDAPDLRVFTWVRPSAVAAARKLRSLASLGAAGPPRFR
jgi:hypothetical protein